MAGQIEKILIAFVGGVLLAVGLLGAPFAFAASSTPQGLEVDTSVCPGISMHQTNPNYNTIEFDANCEQKAFYNTGWVADIRLVKFDPAVTTVKDIYDVTCTTGYFFYREAGANDMIYCVQSYIDKSYMVSSGGGTDMTNTESLLTDNVLATQEIQKGLSGMIIALTIVAFMVFMFSVFRWMIG